MLLPALAVGPLGTPRLQCLVTKSFTKVEIIVHKTWCGELWEEEWDGM